MFERLRTDLLSAVRTLGATPGPVAWAVVTLAIAVGLNLAMVGLVHRALLSPPAHVVDAARVFAVAFQPLDDDAGRAVMTTAPYPAFEAIRRSTEAAAWQRLSTVVVLDGTQIAADAMLVSDGYFELVGVRPRLGRAIGRPAAESAAPPAVLSHGFWNARFGGDRSAIGRPVFIRGVEFTVAGVMPDGFSGHSAERVDVWVPFEPLMRESPGWETNPFRNVASVVVRLKPGEAAAVAAEQLTASLAAQRRRVSLRPLSGAPIGSADARIVYWLTGVSVLVLAIGLANAATLLMVRGARRRRDLAIRAALGASRARLLTQVSIEAAIVAGSGIALAVVLGRWFDDAVRHVLLPSIVSGTRVPARVLGAAALAGLLAFAVAAIVGIRQVPSALRPADLSGAARGGGRRRTHAALLVVQTAMSVVLLVGAGLFGRSLYNLVSQDFGMRMERVLVVEFEPGAANARDQHELFASALDRVRALPGVDRATVINGLPFAGHVVPPIGVPGRPAMPNVNGQLPFLIPATPDLFDILELRLVEGRRFTDGDDRGAYVALVNETMARTVWPGERAIGKCIRAGFDPSFDPMTATGPPGPPVTVPCREIVGIVRDVRQRSVLPDGAEARLMQYYVPFSQVPRPPIGVDDGPPANVRGLLVRTRSDAAALVDPIRNLVTAGRTDLPFLRVREYADLLERQMRPWRLGTMLLSLFGALALSVAAMGLYAAFDHAVHERRREMAIRIAVGARPAAVLRMMLRESAAVAAVGVVLGSTAALAGGRWIESLLFGTVPADPVVLLAAAAIMIGVALAATFLPARRASGADPNTLLRAE